MLPAEGRFLLSGMVRAAAAALFPLDAPPVLSAGRRRLAGTSVAGVTLGAGVPGHRDIPKARPRDYPRAWSGDHPRA